jgi:mannose-6-phosphate isomerase-like protein (cupin superfamily)
VEGFIANDGCRIQELVHPKNDPVGLPYSFAVARLAVGARTYRHRLLGAAELYYIVAGQGRLWMGEGTGEGADAAIAPISAIAPGVDLGPGFSLGAYVVYSDDGISAIAPVDLGPGDAALVPPGAVQWLENTGPEELRFTLIVSPPWTAATDERLE